MRLDDAVSYLKAHEPRVMSLEDICESIEHDKRISVYLQQKDGICREPRPALYTNLYGEGIDLRLGVDYVDYGGWLEQIVLYTKEYLKTWCLWTSCPTDEQREATPWDAQSQREYEAAVEMTEYCERYEPTYNAEDGSM